MSGGIKTKEKILQYPFTVKTFSIKIKLESQRFVKLFVQLENARESS